MNKTRDFLFNQTQLLFAQIKFTHLRPYLRLMRVDNWFKNIFIFPGILVAYCFAPLSLHELLRNVGIGLLGSCLICSANYVINEWLDRDFDKFHPIKKNRSSVVDVLPYQYIVIEYVICATLGLFLSALISIQFLIMNVIFLGMGILYNVKPIRTKDHVYLDVLSESINNPIRLLLGWFMVTSLLFPPTSLLLSYWMGGAFLMGIKRLAEFRFIGNPHLAGCYRQSFKWYSDQKLLASSLFYAMCSAFFGIAFILKYKPVLLLLSPLYAMLFSWYLFIGLKINSIAQYPERMFTEKLFLFFVFLIVAVTFLFLFFDISYLNLILNKIIVLS